MKRFASILAVALMLAVGAGSAQAAKADKADKAAKKEAKGMAGTVTKVDGKNIVVQGAGKKAGSMTITTDDKTTFEGAASLADIKEGMYIQATPGNGTATKITVTTPKEKKAKGAKKAK